LLGLPGCSRLRLGLIQGLLLFRLAPDEQNSYQ
jgi:hypothetical protein